MQHIITMNLSTKPARKNAEIAAKLNAQQNKYTGALSTGWENRISTSVIFNASVRLKASEMFKLVALNVGKTIISSKFICKRNQLVDWIENNPLKRKHVFQRSKIEKTSSKWKNSLWIKNLLKEKNFLRSKKFPLKDKITSYTKQSTLESLTTLKTAQVAISVLDIKNIAIRMSRLLTITWPGALRPSWDDSDVCKWLKYKNKLNDSSVAPNDPYRATFLQKNKIVYIALKLDGVWIYFWQLLAYPWISINWSKPNDKNIMHAQTKS